MRLAKCPRTSLDILDREGHRQAGASVLNILIYTRNLRREVCESEGSRYQTAFLPGTRWTVVNTGMYLFLIYF
jgi:hypothetical protein